MKLLLTRYDHDDKQTMGILYLLNNSNQIINQWHCLELPWLNNERRKSCIPVGTYKARKHKSPRFGQSLWIQDVPNRSEILIHRGNYHRDVLGCILVGKDLRDIDKDGYLDVTESVTAVRELLDELKRVDSVMIEIKNSN